MPSNGKSNLEILENDLLALSAWRNRRIGEIDEGFLDVERKLCARYKNFRISSFAKREITPFIYEHSNKASLLFSGGRVSLATALWLKEMGKDIELIYFAGEDKDQVIDLMYKLNMPFTVIHEEIPDSDAAGMFMIHKALENAIKNHYAPIVYMGYFEYALMEQNKSKDWRYCNDFIGAYADVVKKYVDGAKVLGVMPNYTVVNDIILKHPEYQYIK